MTRYIKKIDGKWYDVYVDDSGEISDVKITDEKPKFDEEDIIYNNPFNGGDRNEAKEKS